MKIFVNDKPLEILSYKKLDRTKVYSSEYQELEALPEKLSWKDDMLFHEPSDDLLIRILYVLRTRKLNNLDSITLVTKDKKRLKDFLKSRFFTIKAAGGIVVKDNLTLLIFRLGKWDFPKGKFEKGETPEECGLREVEEECGIKVKMHSPICTTWHTYTHNRKSILKKTYWYKMSCVDDSGLAPQTEEGIEDIRWFEEGDVRNCLVNSYPSMRYLYKQFLKKSLASQRL